MDYKDLADRLDNHGPYSTEECAKAITELIARAEEAEAENKSREEASFREHSETHYWRDRARKAENERDAAQSIIAQDIGVTGVDAIKTCFSYPLEKVKELVEADKAGRCIVLDQDTVLSMLAGSSAIRQNNRLCLSTYLFDMKKKYGGPFQIDYIAAEENLRKIGYAALKGEKDG